MTRGGRHPASKAPLRQRRALSHVGGKIERAGDEALARVLAFSLDVPTSAESEDAARADVHGFHAYPARMHPLTARRLVEGLSSPGDVVLDPFCGSGTVVVEARRLGRRAMGVDASPFAVRLAELKARGSTEAGRARLVDAARRVAEHADARRKAKAGASRRYGSEDVALFAPHVLLELDGLRAGIDALADRAAARDLDLVLSSILTKLSRRASDTSAHETERRVAAGWPARLFVRKTEELAARLAEAAPELSSAPPARLLEGDARRLEGIGDASVDLVVTSPPYPGVYDYLDHHAARMRWLRLDTKGLAAAEIGAKRHLVPLGRMEGRERWRREVEDALRAVRRVLRPRGKAVWLIADGVIAGAPVPALELLGAVAPAVGLSVAASASQARPAFHRPSERAFSRMGRREHAVAFVPMEAARAEDAARECRRSRSR